MLWAVLGTMTLAAQSSEKEAPMPPIPTMRGLSHDYIIENEKIEMEQSFLNTIKRTFQSDIRSMVNFLPVCDFCMF